MSSFCRHGRRALLLAALAVALAAARQAHAIQLSAVYTAACQREIGVILAVDRASIRLLTLSGEVHRLNRYDIIYLAQYPVGTLPIPGVNNPDDLRLVTVRTRHDDRLVELVRGWLIDHSDVELAFLAVDGFEVVIRVDDIWAIELEPAPPPVHFNAVREPLRFEHPYPFRLCADDAAPAPAGTAPRTVYPQTLLADPVQIKRELDHLEEGHERIADLAESQAFYPVPRLYDNETRLGLWANAGSRHGVSHTRTSSLVPALTSELSEGPFGFQRVLVAGAAPMPYSVHEEVQTQFYYRLKADYVHFSFNYDVSWLLIGGGYAWIPEDLGTTDDRWNEVSHLAGGFDYGRFAGDVSLTTVQYAVRDGEKFFTHRVQMPKGGVFYRDAHWAVELYYGRALDRKPDVGELARGTTDEEIAKAEEELARIPDFHSELRLYRLNVGMGGTRADRLRASVIYRSTDFHREPNKDGAFEFRYRGSAWSYAVWWRIALNGDLSLSLMAAVEDVSSRAGVGQLAPGTRHVYPKGGLNVELKL